MSLLSEQQSWIEPPYVLSSGHKLFYANTETKLENGKPLVAIADQSGWFPQDTSDGVLWLDFDKPLFLGEERCFIPLKTPDSEDAEALVGPATIVVLSHMFNWEINVRGILFNVKWRKV